MNGDSPYEPEPRTIDHFIINGIVTVNGVDFWRIDNMARARVGIDFLRKPDALILSDVNQADKGRPLAEAVCKALNGLEAAHG